MGHVVEGISESKLALQLDPVSSRAFMNSAFSYYFARQYGPSAGADATRVCVAT